MIHLWALDWIVKFQALELNKKVLALFFLVESAYEDW